MPEAETEARLRHPAETHATPRHVEAISTDHAAAIFEWLDGFYNPSRRHNAL